MSSFLDGTGLLAVWNKIKSLFWLRNENATEYTDSSQWNVYTQTFTIEQGVQVQVLYSSYMIKNIKIKGMNVISNGYTITLIYGECNPSSCTVGSEPVLCSGGNIKFGGSGSMLNLSVPRQLIHFGGNWYTNFAYQN